ncbi:MAG: hypothetical protein Q4B26_19145 [Eubacteriales bacterium]|nr:hypothetical protein [Eubacteriales bacterium]
MERMWVSEAEIVAQQTSHDYRPYYAIKYKRIGSKEYEIGYGSYNLAFVTVWLEAHFKVVPTYARGNLCEGCEGSGYEGCTNCDRTYAEAREYMMREAVSTHMADKKNAEGYNDPTAYGAERAVERTINAEEYRRRTEEAEVEKDANRLVGAFKIMAKSAGYEIDSRIILRHRKTGKVFR